MDDKLYLFTADLGWRGSIVVVARNEDDARRLMKDCYNYQSSKEGGLGTTIEKHEMTEGFLFYNLGDL